MKCFVRRPCRSKMSLARWVGVLLGIPCFLIFFLPMAFSATSLSLGNIGGMGASLLLVLYCLFQNKIHSLLLYLWGIKPVRVLLLLLCACVLSVLLVVLSALAGIFRTMCHTAPVENTVVVLGCMVRGDVPSLSLQYRIDTAYGCLQENPDAVCILSGGQGNYENVSEAACMARELIRMGISEDRLILEDKSTSTYENLLYSAEIIRQKGLESKVTIVSSDFHLFRGCLAARDCGLTATARGSKSVWYLFPTYLIREACAVVHYHFWGY